jgi:hypothetical protein
MIVCSAVDVLEEHAVLIFGVKEKASREQGFLA